MAAPDVCELDQEPSASAALDGPARSGALVPVVRTALSYGASFLRVYHRHEVASVTATPRSMPTALPVDWAAAGCSAVKLTCQRPARSQVMRAIPVVAGSGRDNRNRSHPTLGREHGRPPPVQPTDVDVADAAALVPARLAPRRPPVRPVRKPVTQGLVPVPQRLLLPR